MSLRKGRRGRADRISIPEFFEDKTVFITGATGFMGKVLLEKLLRSCPGLQKVYILMRPKKGKDLEQRLREMLDLPMFIRIRRGDPDAFNKIVALEGDVSSIGLGLKEEDAQRLKNEVSIIYHVAACVRFDDKLTNATFLNLRGTYETVKLGLEMKKLECLLHMSTAYCIKHREFIDEKTYPPPADWRQILKIVENTDENTLNVLTPKLMGTYPNTYTFTKALAEQVVLDYSDRIPSIIFRPSIVISAVCEPLPGWVDNFNGPVAMIVASGKGIVRTIFSNPNVRSDFIPVDLAVKAMIVSVWDKVTSQNNENSIEVYNAAAGGIKSLTQKELVDVGHYVTSEIPLNNVLWLPGGRVTSCKFNYLLQVFLFHFIPAIIVDSLLKLYNQPPLLGRVQRKIFLANTALEYFLLRQWNFVNKKLITLDGVIQDEDRAAFSYYMPDLDLIEYFRTAAYGGRQFLMKEDNTDLEPARKHYRRMYWVEKISRALLLILALYLAVKFGIIRSISETICSFCAATIALFD